MSIWMCGKGKSDPKGQLRNLAEARARPSLHSNADANLLVDLDLPTCKTVLLELTAPDSRCNELINTCANLLSNCETV